MMVYIAVFNKLILTALKFTPVVLNKHMPSKELASGKLCVSSVSPVSLRRPFVTEAV